jgi:hypothetical protein
MEVVIGEEIVELMQGAFSRSLHPSVRGESRELYLYHSTVHDIMSWPSFSCIQDPSLSAHHE